jgi:low affinity Fe/Cu permease
MRVSCPVWLPIPAGMSDVFRRFAGRCSIWLGTPVSFAVSLAIVVVWAATGPLFHFSDSWQLVINTSTTIVTFLMVFLIQATQNRDAQAIQLKLDELIRANRNARNAIAGIESCTEAELQHLQAEFQKLRQKERALPAS